MNLFPFNVEKKYRLDICVRRSKKYIEKAKEKENGRILVVND